MPYAEEERAAEATEVAGIESSKLDNSFYETLAKGLQGKETTPAITEINKHETDQQI